MKENVNDFMQETAVGVAEDVVANGGMNLGVKVGIGVVTGTALSYGLYKLIKAVKAKKSSKETECVEGEVVDESNE